MATRSLVTSIHRALIRIEGGAGVCISSWKDPDEVRIGLRNLKALLLCLYVYRNHAHLNRSSSSLTYLLSRIETVLKELIYAEKIDAHRMAKKVHDFGTALDDSLLEGMYHFSSPLTVDEVIEIADSVADNASDFLSLIPGREFSGTTAAFEVIEAFEVQMRFMKNVLVFASEARLELHDVLRVHIQRTAINAARVFLMDDAESRIGYYEEWCKQIGPKCLAVNLMATDPQVCQAYSDALCITTPLHIDDGGDVISKDLLDSLISLLWDALRRGLDSRIKDQFKVLYERLRFLRAYMKQQPASLDATFRSQIGVLICDAGVLICSFHHEDARLLADLLERFDVFRAQVALEVNHSMANDELAFGDFTTINISDDQEKTSSPAPSQQPPQSSNPQVFGYHNDEVTAILDRLTRGSKNLRVVPICGMAGLGKTTFALKLYNHPSVLHHFWTHAWCSISQEPDKRKVQLHLLNQIQPGDYSRETKEDIANKLRQSLKGRRYLIVLDDVWSPDALDSLKESFPDDSTGSRIVLTSRCADIGDHPYLLRLREDSECLEILQSKLCHRDGWNPDLGMQVANLCKGLPLTLVIVSGILATTKEEGWKAILDHLSSGHNVSGAEQCKIALELGYKHLPYQLQPCFLYFGAFKEVSVKMLIRLWMAEGFVVKSESKSIEDVGREYMEKLIERSLVVVEENRSTGGVKTCRVHDLIHGYCQIKAKQENLIHLLLQTHDQLSDFNEPFNLQRLSIHSAPNDFKESRLFCPSALSLLFCFGERSDSYLFDMSFIIQIFQLLKVLHMDEVFLINGIPNEIGLLTRLRYLSLLTHFPIIPSSVGNLSNLETLIADFRTAEMISFPHTLWNLEKLKCLHIESYGDGFTLPAENLENSSSLLELETLRGVVFYSDDGSMEKQLRKFPRIRRLKCTIIPVVEITEGEFHTIVIPDLLTQLQSLTMCAKDELRCEFGSTAKNLVKLKLDEFELSKEDIAVIGKFPKLEVLKLCRIYFPDHMLEMKEGEFLSLRFLKLFSISRLERWTASSDDELPNLQKLEFSHCGKLQDIPPWLETSSTLEEVRVIRCSSLLESLVRDVQKIQKDYGNSIKLHIVSEELE